MSIQIYQAEPREMELIEAYLEHLRQEGCTEKTIAGRRELLYRLNRDLAYGVGQVKDSELRAWLYRDGWSQNTRATYYAGLNSFYAWAADPEDPWLSDNPMRRLPAVKSAASVPRAATDAQVCAATTQTAEPFRTWAKLAARQGLRCIEISRLDREHIT